jgi:hypothetical protein
MALYPEGAEDSARGKPTFPGQADVPGATGRVDQAT